MTSQPNSSLDNSLFEKITATGLITTTVNAQKYRDLLTSFVVPNFINTIYGLDNIYARLVNHHTSAEKQLLRRPFTD